MNISHIGLAQVLSVGFCCSLPAQVDCPNDLFPYNGPTTRAELVELLQSSKDPALTSLDAATRNSLIVHLHFTDERIDGMDGTDPHIEALYKSNAADVFTAILGTPTIVHASDSGPEIQPISRRDLLIRYPDYLAMSTWVVNGCWPTTAGGCCDTGCHGCRDSIALADDQFFKVIDINTCAVYEPPCASDWNFDCAVNSQDFFDFLASFFAGRGDFNFDGVTNSQDFFDFLAAFFASC